MTPTLFRRFTRTIASLDTITDYNDPRIVETVWAKTQTAPITPFFLNQYHDTVLDFGGGAGYHYLQAADVDTRWAVVETERMTLYCNNRTENPNLHWFTNISSAVAWLGSAPDLIHCNGALQYTPDPLRTLTRLTSLGASALYWDRMLLSNDTAHRVEHSFISDHGPGTPFGPEAHVRLIARPIPHSMFLNAHWAYETQSREAPYYFTRRKA